MKNLLLIFIYSLPLDFFAQYVQLKYSSTNSKVQESVNLANKVLNDEAFYKEIAKIEKFENSPYSGAMIISEMNKTTEIIVSEYCKKWTKANARTQTEIQINTAKLERSKESIVNTLIHEIIHAVDWNTDKRWDYTHLTQYEEKPSVSAPNIIGDLAEKVAHTY